MTILKRLLLAALLLLPAFAPAAAPHPVPQRLLWAWDTWLCDYDPAGRSFLEETIEQAQRQARSPEASLVNQIYLAALSRYPNRKELQQAAHYLGTNPDSLQVLQDMFWALLNSNEFILIH